MNSAASGESKCCCRSAVRLAAASLSDHFGLPTSTDSDILLLLVHLTNVRNGLKAQRVAFSRYELIKFLGWPQDGRSYKRLDESLQRWTSVTLHYKHAWWDRGGQKWKTRSFHILETLELRGRDEIHDDGLSTFAWNEIIFSSFKAGNLKRIDLGIYFRLKLAVARQLFRYLDKRFYLKKTLEFDLRQFATEHIGLSRRYDNYDLKRKLLPALRELEEIGFLKPATPDDRFRRVSASSWVIVLRKGEGDAATPNAKVVSELTSRGVQRKVARDLAVQFSEERIEDKIRLHDDLVRTRDRRISRNAAGFLTSAIRHDYQTAPADRACKPQRDARPSTQVIPFSPAVTAPTTPPAPDRFQHYWNALSLEEQTRFERDALQHASRFHRDTLKRLETANSPLLSETRLQIVREFWSKHHVKS